jgi:glutathione S-transferase
MIAGVGLLNPRKYDVNDKSEAYLRGLAAWMKCKGVVFEGDNRLSSFLTTITQLAGDAVAAVALRKDDLIPDVRIKSVAVWDTVGSMGIPTYISGPRKDFFSFVNQKLSPAIEHGFHAMALDERRRDFPVTRWVKDPRVEEVWFAGAHADVGGGYPVNQSGLSDIALDWMMSKVAAQGAQLVKPSPALDLTRFGESFHTPWKKPPFSIDPQPRAPLPGDVVHPSVLQRWDVSADYRKLWPKGFRN